MSAELESVKGAAATTRDLVEAYKLAESALEIRKKVRFEPGTVVRRRIPDGWDWFVVEDQLSCGPDPTELWVTCEDGNSGEEGLKDLVPVSWLDDEIPEWAKLRSNEIKAEQ